MQIVSVYWDSTNDDAGRTLGARDIHLTPGLRSPYLIQMLWIKTDASTSAYRADTPPSGLPWTVTFSHSLRPASPQLLQGMQFDPATGEVIIGSILPPALRGRSFIITATVKLGTSQKQLRIRVNLHARVTKTWLTPSTLTVRQAATNMRFSVLAQFDDGVIGDITDWTPPLATPLKPGDLTFVRRSPTDPAHRWSATYPSGLPQIQVNPVTGTLSCPDPNAAATVNVHFGTGPAIASASAYGASPWSTPVPLTPVAGDGFAAMGRSDIHNVLFLPDGFTGDPLGTDRLDFEATVRELVHLLSTNSLTRPYDVLSSKFNYFSAWVPSPQSGCSVLAETFSRWPADPYSGNLVGNDVEIPTPPTGAPTALTLAELIGTVGLPAPVNDPPGALGGTDAAGRIHDWQQLYGSLPTVARVTGDDSGDEFDNSSDDVYAQWLRRDTRILINERDTAFHVAADHRPRIDELPTGASRLAFHPMRLTMADFNTFLLALRDKNGNPLVLTDEHGATVPPVWAEGGKDDALVVIVCRTTRWGGQNNFRDRGRYLCVPIGGLQTHVYRDVGTGFDVVPDPVPDHVDPGLWAVVAHELAHTFTIDDEYTVGATLDPSMIADIQAAGNTQERASLLVGGQLMATDIKWRWRRLREAGVLRDPAPGVHAVRADPATPGQFLLSLRPGQAAAFVDPEADILRLRKRTPRDSPQYSDRLRLLTVDHDQLTVRPITGSTLDPAAFGAGDLVVAPVRAADPDFQNDRLGDDLGLVHPVVVDRINATHNPLNAAANAPLNRPCTGPDPNQDQTRVPATNFVTRPNPPRLSYRIVGLYEGGHTVDCGVYHPTGQCVMNVSTYHPAPGTLPTVAPFCPVCQYTMVDLIDPSGHGRIDADYDHDYPRP